MTTEIADADWFLQQIVDWANKSGLGVGVTLNVGGLLVSGTTISGAKYFNDLAKQVGSSKTEASDELLKTLSEIIGAYASIYEVPDEAEADSGEPTDGSSSDALATPTFIHLADARFFYPNAKPLPHNRGVLWRGKVSQVNAFSLGILNAE